MHSMDEIRRLAEAYIAATPRMSATTLSRRITGGINNRIIPRLLAGQGMHGSSLQTASRWFEANWPDDLPWPLRSPRGSKVAAE